MRRIIGNLDFETQLAIESTRANAAGRRPGGLPSISPAVLDTVSSLATLLRALATEGDHLWTPHLVESTLVEDVPGLPRPVLESGPEVGLKPASALLAWGETKKTAHHRARGEKTDPDAAADPPIPAEPSRSIHPIADWLWSYTPAPPEAVARVNDRSFYLELAQNLGHALPGARILGSLTELEEHLSRGGAAASSSGEWVLKAPFSAAGRERLRASGSSCSSNPSRSHAENLFARYGFLLFEPWLDRIDDFGCCALLDERDCRIVSLHRQEVDGHGRITGLELEASPTELSGFTDEQRRAIEEVVGNVGRALAEAGYRGPFGIDGWWYRDVDGRRTLHALGEINARISFGLVARVLVDRLELPYELLETDRWILRFGDADKPHESARTIPLVKPSGHVGGARLEVRSEEEE